jgi:post-segregation antitoxin (ccd killing protein)
MLIRLISNQSVAKGCEAGRLMSTTTRQLRETWQQLSTRKQKSVNTSATCRATINFACAESQPSAYPLQNDEARSLTNSITSMPTDAQGPLKAGEPIATGAPSGGNASGNPSKILKERERGQAQKKRGRLIITADLMRRARTCKTTRGGGAEHGPGGGGSGGRD